MMMKRILALFILAYWSAFFGVLAFIALTDGGVVAPIHRALDIGQWTERATSIDSPLYASGLAFGLILSAVLFIWTFLSALFEKVDGNRDTDELARLSFGVGTGMMMVLMATGVAIGGQGPFVAASIHIVALMVSYMAMRAEARRAVETDVPRPQDYPDGLSQQPVVRLMALGAAHNSMLSKLSGRSEAGGERQS
ncbi:hypothetical protein GN330_10560 [Nitratireductor sp. CAU 1489]|uniref:Uncharacterized protein n=1 Tax=Nitratireductor arenosus TaxID=2682096 RepID=A0A844QF52_9HYPH|nr:hypothetical protein [Nitratireductor arenosus]MVA97687.1 hypothetical protein [Nitratireductor arenosus]